VPPTLLELLGAAPSARAEWCNGANLLTPLEPRARVFAGWEELGLATPSGIFRVPREPGVGEGTSVCDEHWQILADQRGAFEREGAALARLAEECARFLAVPERVAQR
jgi:hypothetical protein